MYGGVIWPEGEGKTGSLREEHILEPAPALDLTIGDLAAYIWHGRTRILAAACMMAVLAIAYLGTFSQNSYRALATVRLDPKDLNVVEVQAVQDRASVDVFLLNTELRVVQSHAIVERVIDQLDLQNHPSLTQTSGLKKKISEFRTRLLGETTSAPSEQDQQRRVIDAVRKMLDIRLIRETYIVEIRAETGDAELSANIANAVAQAYTEHQLAEKLQATQDAFDWLESELDGLSIDLLLKDREIAGLRAALESTSETELELDTREIRFMRARLLDLYNERARLLTQITQNDIALAANPNAVSVSSQSALSDRLDLFDQQIASLESTLEGLTNSISVRAVDLNRLKELERTQTNTEEMHERFSNRLRETVLQFGLVRPDARILSVAPIPNQPSGPKWLRSIAMATFFGATIAALLILLKNLLSPTIQSQREWARITYLPLLAQLPSLQGVLRRMLAPVRQSERASSPKRYFAELRTRLTRQLGRPHGVISICANSRKSHYHELSASLAASYALLPQARVLLIDLDFGSKSLQSLVPSKDARMDLGLLLNAPEQLENLRELQKGLNGFDVLYAGETSLMSLDLLAGGRMANLIRVARQRYDWIIVNLPTVSDGVIVPMASDLGDYLLYVVSRKSKQSQITEDIDYLRKDVTRPIGSVLTNVKGADGFALPTTHNAFMHRSLEEPAK